MGICKKCYQCYPPDFINEENGEKFCHFCKYKKDYLEGSNGIIYNKNDVLEDYRILLENISKNPKLLKESYKE